MRVWDGAHRCVKRDIAVLRAVPPRCTAPLNLLGCPRTGLNSVAVAVALGARKVIAVAGSAEHIALAHKVQLPWVGSESLRRWRAHVACCAVAVQMGAHVVINRHDGDVVSRIKVRSLPQAAGTSGLRQTPWLCVACCRMPPTGTAHMCASR